MNAYLVSTILAIVLMLWHGVQAGRYAYKSQYFKRTLEFNKHKFSEEQWGNIQRVIDKWNEL